MTLRSAAGPVWRLGAAAAAVAALAVDLPDDIRYEVSNASDAQIARLTQCLQRFPAVAGIELSSPSGD